MKLNFCVLCGTTEKLHHHHVIPKVKGGTDDEDNLITLCEKHHEMIHNIQQCDDFFELARLGRERARREGVKFGMKPRYEHLYPKITEMYCKEWKGLGTIGKELGISRGGVAHIVRRLGIKNKRGPKPPDFKKYKQHKNGQFKLF